MNDKINLLVKFFNNKRYSLVTFNKLSSIMQVSFCDTGNNEYYFFGKGKFSIINYFSTDSPYMKMARFKL